MGTGPSRASADNVLVEEALATKEKAKHFGTKEKPIGAWWGNVRNQGGMPGCTQTTLTKTVSTFREKNKESSLSWCQGGEELVKNLVGFGKREA